MAQRSASTRRARLGARYHRPPRRRQWRSVRAGRRGRADRKPLQPARLEWRGARPHADQAGDRARRGLRRLGLPALYNAETNVAYGMRYLPRPTAVGRRHLWHGNALPVRHLHPPHERRKPRLLLEGAGDHGAELSFAPAFHAFEATGGGSKDPPFAVWRRRPPARAIARRNPARDAILLFAAPAPIPPRPVGRMAAAARAEESPGSTEIRRRITSGGGDPRESATESKPPARSRTAVRVKGCGKSAPRRRQRRRHGKPRREQDRIGTKRARKRVQALSGSSSGLVARGGRQRSSQRNGRHVGGAAVRHTEPGLQAGWRFSFDSD